MEQQTLALHHAYDKDASFRTMAVPIYQTTAYDFGTVQRGADLFALKELGPIYTRLNNPTTDVFEARVAAMEGGAMGIATASGQTAVFYTIANLAEAGDNILVAKKVYGGTTSLVNHTIKRFGIETRLFDPDEAEDLEELIDEKTKLILFESLSNPQISIPNVEKIVSIANKYNILSVCDNTVATPILFKPFDYGVDIVIHSTSKYMSGQGLSIGGIAVERNNLNEKIKDNPRYKHFNEPDESYHGLVYTDLPLPNFSLRMRLSLIRDIGGVPAPFNSWLLIQGLETLSVRMKKHSKNTLKVAKFLASHPKVESVVYPGLKNDKQHKRAMKYFKDGLCSGLLNFNTIDEQTAIRVLDNVKIFSIATNIGDSKSVITHPTSTTHQQVPLEELAKVGVTPCSIRLSVGLEDPKDLIEDLNQALG
ncbi:MAG: O-acetylhomoserine aminocarboxypropyltransferase [Proteobacteria bacterium]|nr:MAG: O-acetylhomoserine aminocarboxypropyltransferase [Pseudomonadota bacterium]